jgi:hypothetical protein
MPEDLQQDTLRRINAWVERLEEQITRLLDAFQPEELQPAQAASVAGKYLTLLARLLELRQQYNSAPPSQEELLFRIIYGQVPERSEISEEPAP